MERHQEAAEDHGVVTNAPISVDEFKQRLKGGEGAVHSEHEGAPHVE